MNRRNFIKRGAIWCPAIVGLKAYPQALTLADPAKVLGSAATLTCTSWITQTTDNDFWNPVAGGTCSQRIQNSVAREVCKAMLKAYDVAGGGRSVRCAVSNDATGSSIVGTWSNTVTVSAASGTWYEWTWATNPTTPAGDFYLVWDQTDAVLGWRVRVNFGVSSHTYSFYLDGAQKNTSDACYEIHTMQ